MTVETSKLASGRLCWRVEETHLMLPDGGSTPDRCVKCNAPALGFRLTKKFAAPPPVGAGTGVLAIFRLFALITFLSTRETAQIHFALCPAHRARRTKWIWIARGAAGLGVVLLIAGGFVIASSGSPPHFNETRCWWGIGVVVPGILLVTGGIIWADEVAQTLGFEANQQGMVLLKGAGQAFLQSLPRVPGEGQ